MSETLYKVLDFSRPIDRKSFGEVMDELKGLSPSHNTSTLSNGQLKTLIAAVFTYALHYDEVPKEQRELLLKAILEGKQPLFDLSQTFARHLINNLDGHAKSQLEVLQNSEYDLERLLTNETLVDYVEIELLDQTTSYRKWEYGRFSLAYLAAHLSIQVGWENVEKTVKEKKQRPEVYLKNFGKELENSRYDLDAHEQLLLHLIVKSKLWPDKTTMPDYLLAGSITQQNLLGLSIRSEKLASTLKNALQNVPTINKRRGGPKL
jgi:ribosome biogenesis SPOUT family RNA methylase Rps3